MSTSEALEADEERLGRLALTGTDADFAAFYEVHEGRVYNVTYRVAGNPDVAAEATQEAFSRIWARREDLAARGVNVTAYLYRTARNLVIDHHRGRGREITTDEIDVAAGADVSFEADAEAGELLLAQQDEIREANSRLPEKQRLVLALREFQGLSYEEIAEVMETTAGGVAQLLLRARIAFRRELRLGQIDEERLAGGCRALLPEIVALIDDQLPVGREEAVREHLSNCGDCRAVKAACEEAGQRYRAWLPLAGLGTSAARAAPWVAGATTLFPARLPLARPSRPAEAAGRSGRGRVRAATIAAIGLLVVAVPLALPSLTARESPPPAAAEPEPGPCLWCERLDQATAPGPEPPAEEPAPTPPRAASAAPSPAPVLPPVAPAPSAAESDAPDPDPPPAGPAPAPAAEEPAQVAGEGRAPEPAPELRDPQPLPEPAPQADPEPPPEDPAGERPGGEEPGDTGAVPPGRDPGKDPGGDPGTDPGRDPGGRDPGTPDPPGPDLNDPVIGIPPRTSDGVVVGAPRP